MLNHKNFILKAILKTIKILPEKLKYENWNYIIKKCKVLHNIVDYGLMMKKKVFLILSFKKLINIFLVSTVFKAC